MSKVKSFRDIQSGSDIWRLAILGKCAASLLLNDSICLLLAGDEDEIRCFNGKGGRLTEVRNGNRPRVSTILLFPVSSF